MEDFRNNPRVFVYIAELFSAGILVIYFLMLTLDARGQAFTDPIFVRPSQNVHSAHQAEKVRKVYTSQIGVREKLNNSGKEVEQYLKYVNLRKGNPWCAAFVCWVYGRAGVANPKSGWSPALFGQGRVIWRNGEQGTKSKDQGPGVVLPDRSCSSLFNGRGICRECPSLAAIAGDIFGLYFSEKGRIAHVGFIDEWKDPWVVTVEGNTNVLGSREGDGVYRKRRLVRSLFQVARYLE